LPESGLKTAGLLVRRFFVPEISGATVGRPMVKTVSLRNACFALFVAVLLGLFGFFTSRVTARVNSFDAAQASDPWSSSQTVSPDVLAQELGSADSAKKPTVVCVGFHTLYEGAHIPGAVFRGPGSTPQGIAEIKTWAKDLPRSANIVLYCGCCPLERCPNLKPAFTAMRDVGFSNLRVLLLTQDFNTDWIEKGYPIEKGK
jgi:thiosulfate/3-mercaptopyruvate sulfurtransferase